MRNVSNILVGKSVRKRPFGRNRRRWETVVVDHKKIGCEDVDWIQLTQNKVQWRFF
jgi:hypothetical protein